MSSHSIAQEQRVAGGASFHAHAPIAGAIKNQSGQNIQSASDDLWRKDYSPRTDCSARDLRTPSRDNAKLNPAALQNTTLLALDIGEPCQGNSATRAISLRRCPPALV
jgi:hypothetical protein